MSFNAATRTFSGTPANGDIGTLSVKVTATDGSAASVSDTFTLSVGNTNDAPTLANAIADQWASDGNAFSFTVPANSFADADVGDTLTYTATLANGDPLPAWLSFNPTTRAFTGTPATGDLGSIDVKVTATDGSAASATDTFTLNVGTVMAAPAPGAAYLLSASSSGTVGDKHSSDPSISADGRYVTFTSGSTNLVSDDTNGVHDVFRKDTLTGDIVRVSTSSAGVQGNGHSTESSISADGRYVTFTSASDNLVAGDTNGATDVFRKDMVTGDIVRVSSDASGAQGLAISAGSSISADGRYVAFRSEASNLVADDTNGRYDAFVKDMQTGAIVRASTNAAGVEGSGHAGTEQQSMSADGRYVVFVSYDTNLIANDNNSVRDVYRKDLLTGEIVRVSEGTGGVQGNGDSQAVSISADGRYVSFLSFSNNFAAGDTNNALDVFRKDLVTGELVRVSQSAAGVGGNGESENSSISADGRYITFTSAASNLVAGDNNNTWDTFRVDMITGEIVRLETGAAGDEGNDPVMTPDGRFVAYRTGVNNWDQTFVVDFALTYNGTAGVDVIAGKDITDTIFGNAGNDLIDGAGGADRITGGAGADKLTGGSGADTFIYKFATDGGDTITGFVSGTDKIEVAAATFGGGLTAGGAVSLVSGASPAATLASGQFLYNTTTGQLYWDADGTGGGAATLIATLTGAPAISASDFTVVATLPPLVIDLGGDGISLISGVSFDFDGDGMLEVGGWASPTDGMLALDRNGNGVIDNGSEISFIGDSAGAQSDLQGLRGFDTNGDGVLSAADDGFNGFSLWRDANSNGVSDAGELVSLTDAGIASISLTGTGDPSNQVNGDIIGYTTVAMTNGATVQAADVMLNYGGDQSAEHFVFDSIETAAVQVAEATHDLKPMPMEGVVMAEAFDFSDLTHAIGATNESGGSVVEFTWAPQPAGDVPGMDAAHLEIGAQGLGMLDYHAQDILQSGQNLALEGITALGTDALRIG
ncbi:hypothetical protein DF3PB_230001 [uncultured Defluviicoccus sp.]|uniref:Dystroglycan-type cadherin-like domain-containing protein n=1 Tax=metagenome TaxID=256318 RepID=A0A380TEA2_9ZZZZ|nr:hypothetical protein DF3PB_230001 [uncultured Defluviicoccus sp.]